MAEVEYISIKQSPENQNTGDVKISVKVLEIILGIATNEVDGVYGTRGTISTSISEFLGKESLSKGVTVETSDDNKLNADVYVYLDYGVSVPKTSLKIQKELRDQTKHMTDLELDDINVHVVGIIAKDVNGMPSDVRTGD